MDSNRAKLLHNSNDGCMASRTKRRYSWLPASTNMYPTVIAGIGAIILPDDSPHLPSDGTSVSDSRSTKIGACLQL